MKTFKASRMSGGNKLFPSEIILDSKGVTLKTPGFFGGKETTIPYSKIASVKIDCPLLGFSSIIIQTIGEDEISVFGFFKEEVKEMKEFILNKIE